MYATLASPVTSTVEGARLFVARIEVAEAARFSDAIDLGFDTYIGDVGSAGTGLTGSPVGGPDASEQLATPIARIAKPT
jgi:hypothetical protein